MSKRSFLYSAAFIGLVAAGGAAIQPAQAQKGVALQPSTQWAVNKVETSTDGNGYCAVARRFRPNTILTFARNASDEASFALDFQTPRFRQAEPMEVMLDPGAGQQRAFEVYPVSNQAFVIRLGQDEAFFGALEKTGFLRVAFGDKNFHFDLSDIDTGQAKLATCVASSVVPAAGDEGEYAAAPVGSVESNSEFDRDVSDLRRQLEKLRSDNRRMTGRAEAANAGGEVDPERLAMLERENRDLKNRLRDINSGKTDSIRSKKDILTIERLKLENEQLSAALETSQAGDIQGEVLNDQVAALQEENEILRSQSVQADASGVDPNDILSLIQENERLKEELTLKSADADRGDALRAIIDRLENENAELKTGTASAAAGNEEQLAESREQIDALKKENKRLQSVMEASEITGDPGFIVKELKSKVDELSADMEAKEDRLVEMSKLTTEVELLKATNEELEKQLIESALRGPVHARAAATHKVAGLETQNDSLLQKIQSESDAVAAADASSIEALRAENEQLKKTISEGQTLVEENRRLQGEVENLRRENEELKTKTSASGAGGDLAAELQKARDDNETLRVQLQQKDDELREMISLREEVQRLRTENEQLRAGGGAETTNSPIPGGAPNPEVDNLTRENESLRQQIANMNVGAKDTEIAELKARLQEQETKIAAADEAVKKAEQSASAAKKEAKAAQKKAEERKAVEAKAAEEAKAAAASAAAPEVVAAASPADDLLAAPGGHARVEVPVAPGVSPPPSPPNTVEQEMIRLENKLSEAKASGDQMAIQQAARDYMNLKSRLSASQELATHSSAQGPDQASDLLAFDGAGQAQVIHTDKQAGSVPVNEAQAHEQNMSVSASEDPFAEMKVEDDFQGYESVRGGAVKEQGEHAREKIPTPAEVSGNAAPPPSAGWGQATSVSAGSVSHGGVYSPAVGVPQILSSAGIAPAQDVSVVSSASGADKVAYQWKSDKVYGSAIQRPLSDPSRFDSQVEEYLAQTKKRCGHDFAAVADGSTNQNGTRIDTYEIACVGTGVNSSAALVFFNKGDTFTVLAHEAPADDLESAMDIRDRLVKAIGGS